MLAQLVLVGEHQDRFTLPRGVRPGPRVVHKPFLPGFESSPFAPVDEVCNPLRQRAFFIVVHGEFLPSGGSRATSWGKALTSRGSNPYLTGQRRPGLRRRLRFVPDPADSTVGPPWPSPHPVRVPEPNFPREVRVGHRDSVDLVVRISRRGMIPRWRGNDPPKSPTRQPYEPMRSLAKQRIEAIQEAGARPLHPFRSGDHSPRRRPRRQGGREGKGRDESSVAFSASSRDSGPSRSRDRLQSP
jgi:hypothetical protein